MIKVWRYLLNYQTEKLYSPDFTKEKNFKFGKNITQGYKMDSFV